MWHLAHTVGSDHVCRRITGGILDWYIMAGQEHCRDLCHICCMGCLHGARASESIVFWCRPKSCGCHGAVHTAVWTAGGVLFHELTHAQRCLHHDTAGWPVARTMPAPCAAAHASSLVYRVSPMQVRSSPVCVLNRQFIMAECLTRCQLRQLGGVTTRSKSWRVW